jgi:hypothetical protein
MTDRKAILPALQQVKPADAARMRFSPIGPAEVAASLEFFARELRWLQRIRADLVRAL